MVNDAVERTHASLALRREIVRRGLVRGEVPTYGVAGAAAAAPALQDPSRGFGDVAPHSYGSRSSMIGPASRL